jgi:hypothetical protein
MTDDQTPQRSGAECSSDYYYTPASAICQSTAVGRRRCIWTRPPGRSTGLQPAWEVQAIRTVAIPGNLVRRRCGGKPVKDRRSGVAPRRKGWRAFPFRGLKPHGYRHQVAARPIPNHPLASRNRRGPVPSPDASLGDGDSAARCPHLGATPSLAKPAAISVD